jgi:hypothetical protein
MKNWKVFLLVSLSMSVFFAGCNKNDNPDNPDNVINATVRYEASVADNVNYKIRVSYIDKHYVNSAVDIEDIQDKLFFLDVESPWSYEMKDCKYGAFLWISVDLIPRNVLVVPETTVTSRIYIDEKLHKEDTGGRYALVQHILGWQ